MFEVDGKYTNRKGDYTVLTMNGGRMSVRYDDGTEAELKVALQERIWENILADREATKAKAVPKKRKRAGPKVAHYIKVLSVSEEGDLAIPGLTQRKCATPEAVKLNIGDRLIYFAVEASLFFAVATITANPKKGKAKDYLFGADPKAKIWIYPIDIDAHIQTSELAVTVSSIELESIADPKEALAVADSFHLLNEDDFELLAELITEIDTDEEIEEEVDEDELAETDDEDDLAMSA